MYSKASMLNSYHYDSCFKEKTDTTFTKQNFLVFRTDDGSQESYAEEPTPLIPLKHPLQAIAVCKALCDYYDVSNTVQSSPTSLQHETKRRKKVRTRQTTLDGCLDSHKGGQNFTRITLAVLMNTTLLCLERKGIQRTVRTIAV